jgi:hypothetical protein
VESARAHSPIRVDLVELSSNRNCNCTVGAIFRGERDADLHGVSGHGRVWGSPPRKQPERKKDCVLLLRVPTEQCHDGRRQVSRVQKNRRHGISSAHAMCATPCLGESVLGPDSGDVQGMSVSVVRFCRGVRSCGGCSFGGGDVPVHRR